MAKIKLGAIVTEISGKLGGHVFAKNRGGAYMRTKSTPTNPQTSYQMAVRALFAYISGLWSALTDAQRESFRSKVEGFATTNIFGDVKNPSGKTLHQKLNQNLLNSGQTKVDNCPDPADVPFAGLVSVAGAETVQALSATLSGITTGSKLIFYATPSLSQGTKFVKNQLRQIGVVAGATAGAVNILALYTAKYGAVVEGDNVYIGVRVVNSVGQASPMERVKAVIAS